MVGHLSLGWILSDPWLHQLEVVPHSLWEEKMSSCLCGAWMCSTSVICLGVKPDQVVFWTVLPGMLSSRSQEGKETHVLEAPHISSKKAIQSGDLNVYRCLILRALPTITNRNMSTYSMLYSVKDTGHSNKQYTLSFHCQAHRPARNAIIGHGVGA